MKKILIILFLLICFTTSTYGIFVLNVSKDGSITTVESSAVFLDNNSLLAKIQALDSNITSIDKTIDLNRVNTVPNVTLTSDNIVSTSTSKMPIYAWVDSGVINYYTGADNIDLNNN